MAVRSDAEQPSNLFTTMEKNMNSRHNLGRRTSHDL